MNKDFLIKIAEIQRDLKAPKNQRNNFGKYNYRSCEDILEAVKPLTTEKGLVLTISDTIEAVGQRFYVKATAKITDSESGESIETYGYARESDTKKGMDDSQVTGASSSYARKYALNGLFCIDDSKDADTEAYRNQQNQSKPNQQNLACADCGKPFQAYQQYSAQQIYEMSRSKNPDGIARCSACMSKKSNQ